MALPDRLHVRRPNRLVPCGALPFGLLLGCGLLIASALPLRAQNVNSARTFGGTQSSTGPTAPQQRLLLLTNGQVVRGNIVPASTGYLVRQQAGEMFIPVTQVRLEAASLTEAYTKLRKSLPDLTANTHLSLARWCLDQRLYDECRAEIKSALEMEPNREDAQRMLVRLEQIVAPLPTQTPFTTTPPRPTRTPTGGVSLAGLSRQTVGEFNARVHPILQHKCGSVGCHGSHATSDYKLTAAARYAAAPRGVLDANLAATLAFVDPSAKVSPLLQQPLAGTNHPGDLFAGPVGKRQYDLLAAWVQRVNRERPAAATRLSSTNTSTAALPSSSQQVTPASFQSTVPESPSGPNSDLRSDPLLRSVLEARDADAFDPDEFNAMSP